MRAASLKAYRSILRIRLIAGLQYRAAAIAGLSIGMFWGLIETTIMLFFYRLGERHEIAMTASQAVTYIWLGQCLVHLVPMGIDSEIMNKITSGDLVYELCRPLDMYAHWYMRGLAVRLSNVLLKSSLGITFCALLPSPYGIEPPVGVAAGVAALLSLFGALLLSCAFGNILSILLLRVDLGPGLVYSIASVPIVFSGLLVPLAVFPEGVQAVLRSLPFAGLIDSPCALYTGLLPASAFAAVFMKQMAWAAMLIAYGRWLLNRGMNRIVIQGG